MPSVTQLLLRGSALRIVTIVVNIAVSFYMTPLLVHSLGDKWYGTWALLGSIVSYFGMLDLGLSTAAQRFVAHALGRNDERDANELFNTCFALFLLIGVVALLLGIVAAQFAGLIIVDSVDADSVRLTMTLVVASLAISFPFMTFNSILSANLRYDIAAYLQIAKVLLRAALALYAVTNGYGLVGLAAATLANEAAHCLAKWMWTRTLAPWLSLRPAHFRAEKIMPLYRYGIYAFLGSVAEIFRYGVDNIVVAWVLSVSAVTHYSIAGTLSTYFRELVGGPLGLLLPVFAKYDSQNESDELRSKFLMTTRFAVVITVTAGGGVIILTRDFIGLWMGSEYLDAYPPLILLTFAGMLGLMQSPTSAVLYAMAKHRYFVLMTGVEAIANLCLSFLFAHWYELLGVALGTLLPALATKLYFQPRYLCRILSISYRSYVRLIATTAIYPALLQAPLFILVRERPITGYAELVMIGGGYYAIIGILVFHIVLNGTERHYLVSAVPALRLLGRFSRV